MKVLCSNDYPYCVLANGTSILEANKLVDRLNKEDEQLTIHSTSLRTRIYYHWHEVEVLNVDKVKRYG